jgi:hypothetical protein
MKNLAFYRFGGDFFYPKEDDTTTGKILLIANYTYMCKKVLVYFLEYGILKVFKTGFVRNHY